MNLPTHLLATATRRIITETNGFSLGQGTVIGAIVIGTVGLLSWGSSESVGLLGKALGVAASIAAGALAGGFIAKDGFFAPKTPENPNLIKLPETPTRALQPETAVSPGFTPVAMNTPEKSR